MLATDAIAELAEYEAVMSSPLFAGHTNSSRFLKYVCDKYFAGIRYVSEVEIAVESLGRRADFDAQQDSIVRVEAHRVRKRLHEYYEGEGSQHELRLVLPQGAYLPQFVPASQIGLDPSAATAAPTIAPNGRPAATRSARVLLVVIAVLLLAAGLGLYLRKHGATATYAPVVKTEAPSIAASSQNVLIMAGSSATSYTDQLGHVWAADRYATGGEPWSVSHRRILRTDDPQLFLTARQGQDFGYDIPLSPGQYELRLYFAETFYGEDNSEGGGESSRMFDVTANGVPILTDFDPLSDAGGSNTADVRVFIGLGPAADGKLHLRFHNHWVLKGVAFINAIQLTRIYGQSMTPIRWVAGSSAVEDRAGRLWIPDQFVQGGRRRAHREEARNTSDPELYQSERYGNFSYAIPVAGDTTYTLTLYFSEQWFGAPENGSTDGSWVGKRVFDVYCNGVHLLRDLDINKESGGSLKALSKTFHGLKANHQGKLFLSFIPNQDYAAVDALEVIPEKK